MKKTVTANISGTIYNIEDDAFDLMQKYLNSIKMYFSSFEDSEEIFIDFENRISENLYSISNNANEVINSKHVAKIIEIMGKPEDFEDLEIENNNKDLSKLRRDNNDRIIAGVAAGISDYFKIDPFITRLLFVLTIPVGGFGFFFYLICWIAMPKSNMIQSTNRKKFYRDHDNRVIAGIAQGIANYFSINDPFIIRLFFLALIFLNGFGLVLYLIIWISSNYAKTIKQKMDMSGVKLSVDNVEKFVKENREKITEIEGTKIYAIVISPFKLIGRLFDKLFPFLMRIPKILVIFLIIYLTAFAGILLIALTIIQFSLFEPNNELLTLLQTIIVDLPPLTLTMIYINFIISILLFSILLVKLLSNKNVKNSTIVILGVSLFMVTSFNIINLGSNDKLENDIEKIEDFIEDKYFINYNYKLKIN